LLVPLLGAAAVSGAARAAPLAYEDARTLLRSVSDLQQSVEVSKRNYEVRSADSLGQPEVFVNATQIQGIKTGNIQVPPGAPHSAYRGGKRALGDRPRHTVAARGTLLCATSCKARRPSASGDPD